MNDQPSPAEPRPEPLVMSALPPLPPERPNNGPLVWVVVLLIAFVGAAVWAKEAFKDPPPPPPPTPEQVAAREERLRKIEEKKAAELAKFYKTPAGKICKKHPDWLRRECEMVAERKIWVGMHIDMVTYWRGRPHAVNVSNYGRGERIQWCWHDHRTPRCLYGDPDGIVEAYN